jgi:ATP-dependent DNA helicase RecQ
MAKQSARGPLPKSASEVATLPGAGASEKEAESAVRILINAGALVDEAASSDVARIRLLATPARIKSELTDDADPGLGLLRALWRIAGNALETGATVNLDALPPGLAGLQTATRLLDDLQSRQLVVWERAGGGLHVVSAALPAAKLKVDWTALNRRRNAELSKLDVMQKYAYAKTCRRGFVLRYFGDPAARWKCQGCDNCLGIVHGRPSDVAARPRKVRERGSGSKRPRVEEISLAPEEQRLFEALRAKRSKIARAEKVPAFVVFSDRTLAEIARARPSSLAALGTIYGVGTTKQQRYGEDFLIVIRQQTGS